VRPLRRAAGSTGSSLQATARPAHPPRPANAAGGLGPYRACAKSGPRPSESARALPLGAPRCTVGGGGSRRPTAPCHQALPLLHRPGGAWAAGSREAWHHKPPRAGRAEASGRAEGGVSARAPARPRPAWRRPPQRPPGPRAHRPCSSAPGRWEVPLCMGRAGAARVLVWSDRTGAAAVAVAAAVGGPRAAGEPSPAYPRRAARERAARRESRPGGGGPACPPGGSPGVAPRHRHPALSRGVGPAGRVLWLTWSAGGR
jgi:hypothetical protein